MRLQKKQWIGFAMILAFQILFALFWANQKAGFFVDEIWSYGLANSNYHPFLYSDGALEHGWVNGEYFKNYVVADETHRFDYGSVFYNQKMDVHPPLFYIVLHTICSFFPGSFSKWYGIIPNIFYFGITTILVFLWSKKISGNRKIFPWICMIFWGFSIGAVSNVVFIRMYMLLTLWVIASVYLHSCMIIENRQNIRILTVLLLVTFSGFFTQYYFAIVGAFLSFVYILWLAFNKYWKRLLFYVMTMLASLGLVWIIFPDTFRKILGTDSGRGAEAYQNLQSVSGIGDKIGSYLSIISQELFAHKIRFLLAVIFLTILWRGFDKFFYRARFSMDRVNGEPEICFEKVNQTVWKVRVRREYVALAVAVFASAMYILLVSLIAPYQVDRYIFCVYPVIVVAFIALVFKVFSVKNGKSIKNSLVLFALFLIVAGQWINTKPNYLYLKKKDNVSFSQRFEDYDCVYIAKDFNQYLLTNNVFELQNFKRVLPVFISNDDYSIVSSTWKNIKNESVVYIDWMMDTDAVIHTIMGTGKYEKYTDIYSDDKVRVVFFE